MIDWTFNNKAGQRLHTTQTENTQHGYDQAGRLAQNLANEHQTEIAFTAWLEDREGATAYRYPRSRGRPPTGKAMTTADRQAAYRERKKAEGICPCCGQVMPENSALKSS